MRICLITKQYPALDEKDRAEFYMTELARGLDSLGHEVTVLCSKPSSAPVSGKIRVVQAPPSRKLCDLSLSRRLMPGSVRFCLEKLGYWKALSEVSGDRGFDVVETSQPLAGTLLSAFTREIPAVLRVSAQENCAGDNFDEQFQKLIVDYAYSCIDWFSCADSKDAVYLQQERKVDSVRMIVNSASERSELAANALKIYEKAIERFALAYGPHLCRHGAERMMKSTEDMILLYEKMLYELLFRVSYRFRILHWFGKLRSDPGFFVAKLLRRFGRKV